MLRSYFLSLMLLLGASTAALAETHSVTLILGSKALEPSTSLELRFIDAMVAREKVGQTADPAPLVTQPAIKGKFIWLSQRSGVFTPEEPWPLSTTVHLTLRRGLSNADGKPVDFALDETVQSPPLQLKAWYSPKNNDSSDAPADPRLILLFNADMVPAQAERFVHFVATDGTSIAAHVREPERGQENAVPIWRIPDRSLQTWVERFRGNTVPEGPRANQVIIAPAQPLVAGMVWKLVIAAGLPAREEHLRLLAPVEIPIGKVRPFIITADAINALHAQRHIVLTLSKPLAPEVNVNNLSRWIHLDPTPEKIHVRVEPYQVEFAGDFELSKQYRVAVEAGLPSAESLVLARNFSKEIVFKPMPARLGFEEFSTHQLIAGQRQFHLLAINVPRIRVTAKLFTTETLPLAVAAYEHASGNRVPPEKVAGRTIWQQEITGTTGVDVEEQIALAWDEIVGAHKGGAVLLTAEQTGLPAETGGRPGAQALVQLTDLGLVWKQTKSEIFVHVFSLENNKPLAGVRLRALDEKQTALAEGETDASGIARLPAGLATKLLAEHGSDSHLVNLTNWENHISPSRLRMRYSEEDDEADGDRGEALIFTDRGVYKPGDTAHCKAIVRDLSSGLSRIPAGVKARLRITDPRDREFVSKVVTVSETGSISDDIALPAGKLGTYQVVIESTDGDQRGRILGSHQFEVQEYRPSPFEITIGGVKSALGATTFELPVSAKYYMGKPLSKARLSWSLTADDESFAPPGFDDFDFCHAIRDYRLNRQLDRLAHFNDQGEAQLDAHGMSTVSARVPLNSKAPQPRSGRLLCEITDLDQQTVSESTGFNVHSSDFYLGLRRLPEVLRQGEPLPVELVAVRTDGTPEAQPVAATVRLMRIEWQTNRVETAGAASEYVSEPEFQLLAQRRVKTRSVTKEQNRWVIADETESEPIVTGPPGQYLIEAETRDHEGRDIVTTASFHVYGAGEMAWDYRNPFQVDVVADKDEYRAGDTATLLVKTPIQGEALVTVEREKVLRSFVTELRGNAPHVDVPIEAADAPNVFVSIILLRGAAESPRKTRAPEYRVGYCELKIARPEAKLAVYVKPLAPAYQPGEQVAVDCEVLDFEGKAVADSEITLYAVDEGVLRLTNYQTPDPLIFFNQPRPLAVRTALTLPTLLSEDPDEREYVNKGYLVGGGGESGGDRLRKNFVACAFWNATMRTDEQGHLSAAFTAPDSITRYRVIAVAQTGRNQFGSGEAAFAVNKPVMLEPALPRFANIGDKLDLRAVVHNTTDLAGEVEVGLALDETARVAIDAAPTTPNVIQKPNITHRLSLAAHGSVAIDFPVDFVKAGKARFQWSARFVALDAKTTFKDAVETELKVGSPVPLLRGVSVREVRRGAVQLLEGVDPQLLEGSGVVRVSITNSRIIELEESLRQLLHYPYGCVEQTTSSTLPWLTLRTLRGAVPALQQSEAGIAAAVQHGVDRLLSMQTSSGGLAYWPGESEPMLWGSAYGGIGLILAKRQGADLPPDDLERLLKYISEQLRGTADLHDHYGLAPRCLALYTLALAGRAEPAYHELLFKKRETLSDENRALLALAIQESGGPASMIEELLKVDTGAAEGPNEVWFGCESRQTAMRLLAWCRHDADAPAVETLATKLLDGRRLGHWWTTQGNAWALLAVAEYFEHIESANSAVTGRIVSAGEPLSFVLRERAQHVTTSFPIEPGATVHPLRLENDGSGRLFAEVEVETRPPSIEQARQDRGYTIDRHYERIEDDGGLSDLAEPRVGDRVLVTISIDVPRHAEYLVVEDPLPAIFEPVNPVFKTQETRAEGTLTRDWVSSYKELREDRALFFADSIAPGRYTLHYLARVCAAGTATAPAAKVEEMYHPERFGLSGSVKLRSQPLE